MQYFRCLAVTVIASFLWLNASLADEGLSPRPGAGKTQPILGAPLSELSLQPGERFQANLVEQEAEIESENGLLPQPTVSENEFSTPDLKSLMRPSFTFSSEWITDSDFDLSNYDFRVTVPTYPFFGPPPPMVNVGMSYTNLSDAAAYDLPADLFAYSVGLSWMRTLKDRWKLRSMLGVALATDNQNTSSNAWQFRGGLFAIYEPNERWQWVFGAIALGRSDLPVVPAIGAIWQPSAAMKCDLTFPKPKISRLISSSDLRQQWGYLGLELNGATWGYQRVNGTSEQLTYGDWRAVVGWESLPTPIPGAPFTPGRRLGLEFGYVFARELTQSQNMPEIGLSNAIVFGIDTRF